MNKEGIYVYINKHSQEPIYMQIKRYILDCIKEGTYRSGDRIPSERTLSDDFGASRMTIRQAVNELVNEGKLYREQGRGTFVASPKFFQNNLKSFTQTLIEKGHAPSTEVLEFSVVHSLKDISKALDVDEKTMIYKIKRLRKADDIPIALETVYLPKHYCQGLDKFDMSRSLYGILEEQYKYTIETISCDIDAWISDKFQMKIFDVNKRVPLLKVSGTHHTDQGLKLFYEDSYYRSDLYKYHVDLYRRQWD